MNSNSMVVYTAVNTSIPPLLIVKKHMLCMASGSPHYNLFFFSIAQFRLFSSSIRGILHLKVPGHKTGLLILKVGYHTESRCQYQPASFSSAFKLSGIACLVGVGGGGGWFPPQIGYM